MKQNAGHTPETFSAFDDIFMAPEQYLLFSHQLNITRALKTRKS